MKKTFRIILSAVLTVCLLTASAVSVSAELPADTVTAKPAVTATRQQLPDSDIGVILEDGIVYEVLTDTEITTGVLGGAGITVPENSTVGIYVAEGATLTVRGGDGEETVGGGAGILVPQSSTLILTGAGTVDAAGGNAGNGGNGERGDNGVISKEGNYYYGGRGGAGGNGGGGAGAGIGTNGGSGAPGGNQSSYSYLYRRSDEGYGLYLSSADVTACLCETVAGDTCGTDGTDGSSGKKPALPGSIFILGTLTVNAQSGEAGSHGEPGESGIGASSEGFGWANNYTAGAGGGGGAGHGGYAAESGIGPGGSGGGAGGQGGTGGTYWSATDIVELTGATGGLFDDEAGTGISNAEPVICDGIWGGFGGAGGIAEKNLNRYALEIEKEADVTGASSMAIYTYFDPSDERVSLVSCSISYCDGGSDEFTGVKTGSFIYSYLYGEVVELPRNTSRTGYIFGGWYHDKNCTDGPVTKLDADWGLGKHAVYARWTSEEVRKQEETEKVILSRRMELALYATGFVVALSVMIFIVLKARHREKEKNRQKKR